MCCSDDRWDFGFGVWNFPGPRPRRHRRGRGRSFRWRVYERGDLKFVILRLLAERPMHGYEVMRALEEESGGWYKASPGSVYPTLQMLEDEGYLRSEQDNGKKVYHITDEGREYLKSNRDAVDDIFDRVTSFADRFWGREVRGLSGTFSRLAQVTFDRAMRWGDDPDTIDRMREILEDAIRDIERARSGGAREEGGDPGEEGAKTTGGPQA